MNPAEFDDMLRTALLEAQRQDWAEVLAAPLKAPAFSPTYLRPRRKLLAAPFGYGRRTARAKWQRALRTAACVVLTAGIALGGLLAVNPAARAWVARVVVEWFDTNTSFAFVGDGGVAGDISSWRPTYIPAAFTAQVAEEVNGSYNITYKNTTGQSIYYTCVYAVSGQGFVIDNEHSTPRDVTVNGYAATLYVADTPAAFSYLIWVDTTAGIGFEVIAKGNIDELFLIAESIQKK